MAILKKQPTKKCDSDGNIINIVHEEQNVHEGGEKFNSEHPDYFDNENLEFKLVDVSDNISEIQIKNEIDEKIIITPIEKCCIMQRLTTTYEIMSNGKCRLFLKVVQS